MEEARATVLDYARGLSGTTGEDELRHYAHQVIDAMSLFRSRWNQQYRDLNQLDHLFIAV
jgi:hypothetical protein